MQHELTVGGAPPLEHSQRVLGDHLRGWQRAATACLDRSACASLFSDLDAASRALVLSQAGPGGSRAVTVLPPRLNCGFLAHARGSRCCGDSVSYCPWRHALAGAAALDQWGDHRAACPTAGVLGARGAPLESAAARVFREAGARVASNVLYITKGAPLGTHSPECPPTRICTTLRWLS